MNEVANYTGQIMKQSKTSIGRPQLTLRLVWGLRPSRVHPCVVRTLSKGSGKKHEWVVHSRGEAYTAEQEYPGRQFDKLTA